MDTIDNKDKYFKGQQTNETYICFFRHHWISLVREFLYFSVFIFLILMCLIEIEPIKEIIRGNREMKLLFFTGFLMATICMHRFFIKLFNYFINTAILTDMRIIDHKKTVFFIDNIDSIDMAQIQNIEKIEEGILSSIFGYGDIKIYLTASSVVKIFHEVPNAKFHFRCMNRAKEARQLQMRGGEHAGIEPENQNTNDIIQKPLPTIVRTTPIPIEDEFINSH